MLFLENNGVLRYQFLQILNLLKGVKLGVDTGEVVPHLAAPIM